MYCVEHSSTMGYGNDRARFACGNVTENTTFAHDEGECLEGKTGLGLLQLLQVSVFLLVCCHLSEINLGVMKD